MKTPSAIVPESGETFQDVLARIKQANPKLKFSIPPVITLEEEFGKKEAKVIRKGAFKQGFHLRKSLGKDF